MYIVSLFIIIYLHLDFKKLLPKLMLLFSVFLPFSLPMVILFCLLLL